MFVRLRELAGIEHDENGDVLIVPDRLWAGVLSCVWCCSIWVAFGFTLFWLLAPEIAIRVAVVFGFSAGAILIEKYLEG